ncbi:hypothetical protein E6C50_12665 [Flavobacterium supellecticarium]|uniref:Uncharacterized protein n=1 Tax=Flavobacterium supellecticarium TaxID=2565924 RepID=A0A4S3ZTX8_9FLAO|nr:hypothetical protein [Flavobacterium supellecticarium]THF49090.1 hypothetical protein E6C50_12665 [Flavobacterium supellecticarium]
MNIYQNFRQKSPKQRFLFVLGLVFLCLYLFMAATLIIWKSMPVELPYRNRVILAVILIVYAAIRFVRLLQQDDN